MARRLAAIGVRLLPVLVSAAVIVGCGGDATTTAIQGPPGQPGPTVSGTVLMPNGMITMLQPSLLGRFAALAVDAAFALTGNVSHVGPNIPVILQQIGGAVIKTADTDYNGQYKLDLDSGVTVAACPRLIVSVGAGSTLTRAFVYDTTTSVDIDANSEAAVRVILAESSDGCAFLPSQIGDIVNSIRTLPGFVPGSTAFDLNNNTAATATAAPPVQMTVAAALGTQPPPTTAVSTATQTQTPPSVSTSTPTMTFTHVPTSTPSNTAQATPTRTPTTPGNTQTPTNTPVNTNTATPVNTDTPTSTPVNTATLTNTPAETPTNTPAPTNTPSPTIGETSTATNTPAVTSTPTNTPQETATPTNTSALTSTPTNTPQETATPTNTSALTSTPTNTPQETATPTNTSVLTSTPTNTPQNTATFTNTPANTATNTVGATNTPSRTATSTPTNTTAVNTATSTPTPTATTGGGVTPLPNVCGNGITEAGNGETCDDGGTCIGGDNTGAACVTESQCIGDGICDLGPNIGKGCTSNADCASPGHCIHCKTFGGDGCAANCTTETSVKVNFVTGTVGGTPKKCLSGSCAALHADIGAFFLPLSGSETIVAGQKPASGPWNGLITFTTVAASVTIPSIPVSTIACACVRGAAAETCGGIVIEKDGSVATDCTDADNCAALGKPPCTFVHGSGNTASGIINCGALATGSLTPDNLVFTQDQGGTNPPWPPPPTPPDGSKPPVIVLSGGTNGGNGVLINTLKIGFTQGACTGTDESVYGPDHTFCTNDDPPASQGAAQTLPAVTDTATGEIDNIGTAGSKKGPFSQAGDNFTCTKLTANPPNLTGGATAGAFTNLNQAVIGNSVTTNVLVIQ
jgi:hypothetical protein